MPAPDIPQRRSDFKVAVLCALPLEAEAVQYMFERCWQDEGKHFGKAEGDQNVYTTGVIAGHNVVLVHLPRMGNTSAALSAAGLRSSYPCVKLALVVGVCGVVPFHPATGEEIVLGDIIVSTAVTQYDFGRQYPEGFKRKSEIGDTLGRVDLEIRSLLNMLYTRPSRQRCSTNLGKLVHSSRFLQQNRMAKYPGPDQDQLFEATYLHRHRKDAVCEACSGGTETCPRSCTVLGCEDTALVHRERLDQALSQSGTEHNHTPSIHFGRFGSANTVLRSGRDRDRIATSESLIAFEMEGAGIWEQHPTIIIKAACDYADSHKAKTWQHYAAAMSAAFLSIFLDEWTISRQALSQDSSGPVFHMPFDHVPGFVGRANEIALAKAKIFDTSGRRIVSILGLGGVGKTRLVQELMYQIKTDNPQLSLFWVRGHDHLAYEEDILSIGEKLGIVGASDRSSTAKSLVRQRLSNSKDDKWVMILDNADDEDLWYGAPSAGPSAKLLVDYLPQTTYGSIVVTTRSRKIANFISGTEVIALSELSEDQAVVMFKNSLVDPTLADSQEDTAILLDQLAYLPLAIIQASSYINRTQEPVSTYLTLLNQMEDEKIELLSEHFEDTTGYQSGKFLYPVATTWLVSFEQIREKYPFAAKCLSFMACLLNQSIPVSLLPAGKPKEITDALAILTGYSFVKRQGGTGKSSTSEPLYDIHRLVHLATRNWLRTHSRLEDTIKQCIRRVAEVFPIKDDWIYRDKWLMYLSHGQHLCFGREGRRLEQFSERFDLMQRIGTCMNLEGNYSPAVAILHTVVQWRLRTQGASHLATLTSFTDYGWALVDYGDLIRSEKYLQQAVDGQIARLGAMHPETLRSQNKLARLFLRQSKSEEAEDLFIHVLEARTKVLGPEHPDTVISKANLGATYAGQARYHEAELFLTPILEVQKRVLGQEHPSTRASMANLVHVHTQQGRVDQAHELIAQVIDLDRKLLHDDHPTMLSTLIDLAQLYHFEGRTKEAMELETKILRKRRRVLGDLHPDTLFSMHNTACTLRHVGRNDEAVDLMTICADLRLKTLGPGHTDTLSSQHILIQLRNAQQTQKQDRRRERERERVVTDRSRSQPLSLLARRDDGVHRMRQEMYGEPSSSTRSLPVHSANRREGKTDMRR